MELNETPIWQRVQQEPAHVKAWGHQPRQSIALTLAGSPKRIQIWIPNKAEAERVAREIIDLALNPNTWSRP